MGNRPITNEMANIRTLFSGPRPNGESIGRDGSSDLMTAEKALHSNFVQSSEVPKNYWVTSGSHKVQKVEMSNNLKSIYN